MEDVLHVHVMYSHKEIQMHVNLYPWQMLMQVNLGDGPGN